MIYKILKNKKNSFFIILISITTIFVSLIVLFSEIEIFKLLNNTSALTQVSPDAIAVRVIPNPSHYSPLRWYSEQGFKGSPKKITIDGFDAVQEGRTVYVGAANIVNNKLYTNIYLISYNQDAEIVTTEMMTRLLEHWRFNINLDQEIGSCSISSLVCGNNNDCAENYYCSKTENKCLPKILTNCLSDKDCPTNIFCNSRKSYIVRDVKRLAYLEDIKDSLNDYYDENNIYPILSSGTYLPNKTISIWPSWKNNLAKILNTTLPVDPINVLGMCGDVRFDPETCWDENKKEFAGISSIDGLLTLPASSSVIIYASRNNGANYNLCAVMESGYETTLGQGACAGSAVHFESSYQNIGPTFKNFSLPAGNSGFKYEGFVEAIDLNNDTLSWSIATSSSPGMDWSTWDGLNLVYMTRWQRKIYSNKVGTDGVYNFSITINDNQGATTTKNFSITVNNMNKPVVQQISIGGSVLSLADNSETNRINLEVIIGESLDLFIESNELDQQYPLNYNLIGSIPAGLTGQLESQRNWRTSGNISANTGSYDIALNIRDLYNGLGQPIYFTVSVINHPPI